MRTCNSHMPKKNSNVRLVFWHGPRGKTWNLLGMAYGVASGAEHHRRSDSDSPLGALSNFAVLSWVLAGLFAASSAAQATTINAASPSLADVTAAINSARDDDTVILPAGRAAWNSPVKITKGITLIGQTTTDPVNKTADDQTIILVATGGNGNQPLINVNTV